jgi:hypothetical protein
MKKLAIIAALAMGVSGAASAQSVLGQVLSPVLAGQAQVNQLALGLSSGTPLASTVELLVVGGNGVTGLVATTLIGTELTLHSVLGGETAPLDALSGVVEPTLGLVNFAVGAAPGLLPPLAGVLTPVTGLLTPVTGLLAGGVGQPGLGSLPTLPGLGVGAGL